MLATCNRAGVVHFHDGRCPFGFLPIASAIDGIELLKAIRPLARESHDNNVLLVPGVPEANTDEDALNALQAFSDRVRYELSRPSPVNTSSVVPVLAMKSGCS